MSKSIDTLVTDIYELLTSSQSFTDKDYEELAKSLTQAVKRSMERERGGNKEDTLRMSNIGRPDRYLWFHVNKGKDKEDFSGDRLLNFFYGDVLEEIILWLAIKAGHEVTHRQELVNRDGIEGHTDCVLDGVGLDVKSASNYSFNKFINRELLDPKKDPYGYMYQLAGYFKGKVKEVAHLVNNKEKGHLALIKYSEKELPDADKRIKHIKELVTKPEPPSEKCYPDEPFGKSGSRMLGKNCEWCNFKVPCWKDANNGMGLRTFKYSDGLVYLTKVVNKPRVEEVNPDGTPKEKETFKPIP